jgi:hypothetical protein
VGPVSEWEKTLIAALPPTQYDFAPGARFSTLKFHESDLSF